MARKPEQREDPPDGFATTPSAKSPVKPLRVRIVINENDLRVIRYHEDAIARLAVAAEALKTVGNTVRSLEVARIRDEVIADHARFLTNVTHLSLVNAISREQDPDEVANRKGYLKAHPESRP